MSDTLQDIQTKLEASDNSCESLVNAIADKLDALDHDPVAIKALATELRQNASSLSSLISSKGGRAAGQGKEGLGAKAPPETPSPNVGDPAQKMDADAPGEKARVAAEAARKGTSSHPSTKHR